MRRGALALILFLGGCPEPKAAPPPPTAPVATPARAPEVAPSDSMTPAALAAELSRPPAQRPVVLHVGFHGIYQDGHIPGALDMGPAGTPDGLSALEAELRSLPPGREAVLYCGCCPWDHCPNIRPALALARKLGLANVKALAIPQSFRTDWVKPGYPVEK